MNGEKQHSSLSSELMFYGFVSGFVNMFLFGAMVLGAAVPAFIGFLFLIVTIGMPFVILKRHSETVLNETGGVFLILMLMSFLMLGVTSGGYLILQPEGWMGYLMMIGMSLVAILLGFVLSE